MKQNKLAGRCIKLKTKEKFQNWFWSLPYTFPISTRIKILYDYEEQSKGKKYVIWSEEIGFEFH